MIERRAFVLAASFLALTACSSDSVGGGERSNSAADAQGPRVHVSGEDVVGAFLFSLDGCSVSQIGEDNFAEVVEAVSNLDLETSDSPATIPEGGLTGGRGSMFLLVFSSASTVTIGATGKLAIYDSVLYESSYEACQKLCDLYARLVGE